MAEDPPKCKDVLLAAIGPPTQKRFNFQVNVKKSWNKTWTLMKNRILKDHAEAKNLKHPHVELLQVWSKMVHKMG